MANEIERKTTEAIRGKGQTPEEALAGLLLGIEDDAMFFAVCRLVFIGADCKVDKLLESRVAGQYRKLCDRASKVRNEIIEPQQKGEKR